MLTCTSCNVALPNEALDVRTMTARCVACGHVAPIRVDVKRSETVARPAKFQLNLGGAGNVEVDGYREAGGGAHPTFELAYPMGTRQQGILTIGFALFWNGMLYFMFMRDAVASPLRVENLFFLPFVAAGIFTFWFGLATMLNRTRIAIHDGVLTVKHAPIPMRTPRPIRTSELQQVYVRRVQGGKGAVSYSVAADTTGGAVDLLGGLLDPQDARYIEYAIESHLGIVNDPSRSA